MPFAKCYQLLELNVKKKIFNPMMSCQHKMAAAVKLKFT